MTPKQLKKWREKKHKLTQPELAAMLGVDVMTVNRWEKKKRTIPKLLDLALEALDARLAAAADESDSA